MLGTKTWPTLRRKLTGYNTTKNAALIKIIKSNFEAYENLPKKVQKEKDMTTGRLKNVVMIALKKMFEKFNNDTELITSIPSEKNHMVIPLTNRAIESLFSHEKFIEKSKLKNIITINRV